MKIFFYSNIVYIILTCLQSDLFGVKDTNVKSTYIKSASTRITYTGNTYAKSASIKSPNTENTWVKGIYIKNTYTRNAYIRDICFGNFTIRAGTCSSNACIRASSIKDTESVFFKEADIKNNYT